MQSVEEADNAMQDYSNHAARERFEIAWYLTSIACCFDMEHPPRMDKTLFRVKKHED